MSFLSLANGDATARALLQQAIRARYGLRPLPLENLRLWLAGTGTGPLGLRTHLLITQTYQGLHRMRWEQRSKLLIFTTGTMIRSISCATYAEGNRPPLTKIDDPQLAHSFRRYLWAGLALLLTPLTSPDVTLRALDEQTLQAIPNSDLDSVATIRLNADGVIASVEVERYHALEKRLKSFIMRPVGGLHTLDGLMLPRQISEEWQGSAPDVFTILKADLDPTVTDVDFLSQA